MNSNKKRKIISLTIMYILFLILSMHIDTKADDFVFRDGISRYGGFWGWLTFFLSNWGGRIIPQGLLVLMLQVPDMVFFVANAVMWVLLLVYLNRIYNDCEMIPGEYIYFVSLLLIYALIPETTMASAIFWKCATVLYLWGTVGALIAVFPLVCSVYSRKYKKVDMYLAVAGAVYASSFEQIAAFMCLMMLVLCVYLLIRDGKICWFHLVLMIGSIALTACFTGAQGNKIRFKAETLAWYQNFGMYTLVDKAVLGINYTIDVLMNNTPILLLLLCFLACIYVDRIQSKKITILSRGCLLFYFLNFVHRYGMRFDDNKNIIGGLFRLYSIEGMEWRIGKGLLLSECINVMMIVVLGCLIALRENKKIDPVVFATYFGGLGTIAMMAFSPTIHVSGIRPLFIGYLSIILCIISLGSKLTGNVYRKNSNFECND